MKLFLLGAVLLLSNAYAGEKLAFERGVEFEQIFEKVEKTVHTLRETGHTCTLNLHLNKGEARHFEFTGGGDAYLPSSQVVDFNKKVRYEPFRQCLRYDYSDGNRNDGPNCVEWKKPYAYTSRLTLKGSLSEGEVFWLFCSKYVRVEEGSDLDTLLEWSKDEVNAQLPFTVQML